MRRSAPWNVAAALFLTATISGCADVPSTPAATGAPTTSGSESVATRGEPDEAAAPDWRPGDWWTWSLRPRDSQAFEATTVVVSGADGESLVGWGSVNEGLHAQFFHFVPNGPVDMGDVSWPAHGEAVRWLDFPLRDGATWEGGFWITPMSFVAQRKGGTPESPEFGIHGEGAEGGVVVDMVWSTALRTFTHLDFYLFGDEPWLVVDLVGSGRGSDRPAYVFHVEESVIRGTDLVYHVLSQTAPHTPEQVSVPVGATHFSMGCYVGGAPGRYEILFARGADESHRCETTNPGTNDHPLRLAWGPLESGDWTLALTSAGPGSVFVELYLLRAEEVTPA